MNVHQLRALDAEQHIANRGNSLDRDAMSHAQSMFQTTQVKQLLQSPESGVVLVNGLTDRSQHGKISPLTHICATLTHALRRSPGRNVVLAFFCGQHTTTKDDLPGPQGLMRSLVAFLVLELVQKSYISDSAPIYFPELEEDFSELSFTDICQLFYRLVKLIPKGVTVQCIVDGISHYERPQWKEDFDLMMECFGGIITNNDGGAIFKLLLTSPTQSRWLPSILEPHQRVSLRNTNMGRRRRMEVDTYLQTTAESSTSQQYQ